MLSIVQGVGLEGYSAAGERTPGRRSCAPEQISRAASSPRMREHIHTHTRKRKAELCVRACGMYVSRFMYPLLVVLVGFQFYSRNSNEDDYLKSKFYFLFRIKCLSADIDLVD